MPEPSERRRAAVLGKPVSHSLSPVLHRAAYEALGLIAWSYERVEMDAESLAGHVADLGPEWAGLSVTMPGKRAALACADAATDRARAVRSANTLVQTQPGTWRADCTDVDGVRGALQAAGFPGTADDTGVILGAGATAAAAAGAFAEMGLRRMLLVVREPTRAQETAASARLLGLDVELLRWSDADLAALAGRSAALVSTVPSTAVQPHIDELATARCLLDVIYDPWPTPLAEAVAARGRTLGTGLDMLLHQAFGQVEQFTGFPAPREAMRTALSEATGEITPLPLG